MTLRAVRDLLTNDESVALQHSQPIVTRPNPRQRTCARHFGQHNSNEQVALLVERYDYALAEGLIARMRLTGRGPYIVSLLRPLSQQPFGENEAFLTQDLSTVPPSWWPSGSTNSVDG